MTDDGTWFALGAAGALAAVAMEKGWRMAEGSRALDDPETVKLDLTGDGWLTLREARKLARWWTGRGWSSEILSTSVPGRFRVRASGPRGALIEGLDAD